MSALQVLAIVAGFLTFTTLAVWLLAQCIDTSVPQRHRLEPVTVLLEASASLVDEAGFHLSRGNLAAARRALWAAGDAALEATRSINTEAAEVNRKAGE